MQPPLWLSFVTPTIAIVGAIVAWLALRNTRSVARQRATLDLIEKEESSDHYRNVAKAFSEIRRLRGFADLHDPEGENAVQRRTVLDHLNHFEIIAIGIREGILDARIYRAWMEGSFVRDWNAAADWVQRERWKIGPDGKWTYRKSIFENYQWAACRWSKDAIRLSEKSSLPPSTMKAQSSSDALLPEPIDDVKLRS